jgi:hypothetical protein
MPQSPNQDVPSSAAPATSDLPKHSETPETEFLDPEAFLAQDLEDLRKLLRYCLPRATEDGWMLGNRLELMNAAVRMMRLDATLAGMLLRANRGYLRDRKRDRELAARKRPAGQSGTTTGSSYHEWLKRHPEAANRDRTIPETPSAPREKNWNSTGATGTP